MGSLAREQVQNSFHSFRFSVMTQQLSIGTVCPTGLGMCPPRGGLSQCPTPAPPAAQSQVRPPPSCQAPTLRAWPPSRPTPARPPADLPRDLALGRGACLPQACPRCPHGVSVGQGEGRPPWAFGAPLWTGVPHVQPWPHPVQRSGLLPLERVGRLPRAPWGGGAGAARLEAAWPGCPAGLARGRGGVGRRSQKGTWTGGHRVSAYPPPGLHGPATACAHVSVLLPGP